MFRNGRSKDRPLQRVRLDFEIEIAVTRAIEFGVEDALPAAQHQFAIFDEDELAHPVRMVLTCESVFPSECL
jgi:hypothetical protein